MTRDLFDAIETAPARRPRGTRAAGPTDGREGAQGHAKRADDTLAVQGSPEPSRAQTAAARAARNRDQRASHSLHSLRERVSGDLDADQLAAFVDDLPAPPAAFTVAERVLAALPADTADALIEHVADGFEPPADPDEIAADVVAEINRLVLDGSIVARDGGYHLAHHLDPRVYMGRDDLDRVRPWAVAEDNAPVRLPARRRG